MAKLEAYLQLANTIRNNRAATADALRQSKIDEREEKRLKMSEWEHEQKVKQASLQEDAAARLDKMDPNAGALFRAGSPDIAKSLLTQKSDDSKYKKKFEEYQLTTLMTNEANREFEQMQKEINDDLAAGRIESAKKRKEQFAVHYQAKSDMIKNKIASLDELAGQARAMQLAEKADAIFKNMSPEKIDIAGETVNKKISSENSVSSKWIEQLEGTKEIAGVSVDLSGIPDKQSIYRAATAIVHGGKAPQQMVTDLLNIEDPKELQSIAGSEDAPIEIKQLAGTLYKARVATEMFAPGALEDSTKVSNPTHRKEGGFTFDTGSTRTAKIGKIKSAYQVIQKAKEMQAKGKMLPASMQKQLEQARKLVKDSSKDEIELAKR